MKTVLNHFERISGSPNGYPDKNASPYDTFICNHCKETKNIQMYGNFPLDYDAVEEMKKYLQSHLAVCPKFQKWLRESV